MLPGPQPGQFGSDGCGLLRLDAEGNRPPSQYPHQSQAQVPQPAWPEPRAPCTACLPGWRRKRYDEHGSQGLDVNFVDGAEFFTALFGSDRFEHLVRQAQLAELGPPGRSRFPAEGQLLEGLQTLQTGAAGAAAANHFFPASPPPPCRWAS